MSRETSFACLTALPRLDAASAVALTEALLAAAEAESGSGLPPMISRSRARLHGAMTLLQSRMYPPTNPDRFALQQAAEGALYESWRNFEAWLGALNALPDGSLPAQNRVRLLYGMIFGDGLSRIVLSQREEWLESETRLVAMADGGYDPLIEQLGGAPFLTHIKIAHNQLGAILDVDSVRKSRASASLRDALWELVDELKDYAVKAAAAADPDLPGSETLSAALLEPLLEWSDLSSSERDTVIDPVEESMHRA